MKRLAIALAALGAFGAFAEKYEATWKSIDSRPVPQWWTDAKFGIFIHWGPYAVPAYAPVPKDGKFHWDCYAEWYQGKMLAGNKNFLDHHAKTYRNAPYGSFAADFKAEHFDAAAWADLFKRAGAKYVVLTSKHHDGFALWPSPESPYYNAVAMGAGRDLADEFCKAMRAAGLKRGFYFSMLEYANPLYPGIRDGKPSPAALTIEEWNRRVNLPQLKELADRYEADIIWPDGEWDYASDRHCSKEYLAWLYNESKVKDSVVVNDRWGKDCRGHHGGHYTTEYVFEGGDKAGDSAMHPWEECRGIGNSFGYNRFETPDHYMTRTRCIETLVACVARGGNLLLNVGPTADGRIPAIMQDRLLAIGAWLKVNGEAIYGTTRGDLATDAKKVYFTKKGDVRYAIDFRGDGTPFVVKGLAAGTKASLVGSNAPVTVRAVEGGLEITPPALAPSKMPCEHAWVYRLGSSEIAAPRIILDSDRLDYVTFPQDQTEKLNSGWETDGAAIVRPFNRQAAGVVRYGAVFALPADVSAELRFEDAKGNVLKDEKIVGGQEQPVCGVFRQDGSLARVRLVPSKPVAPKGLLARPFRVTVDWAVDEDFTCVAAGRRDGHAGRVTLPAGWRGVKAAVVGLPYLGCTVKNGEKGFDRPANDAVLEIAPGGWADPSADAKLLTKDYAFEFDALVEDDTDFAAAGVRLRDHYAFTSGIWYHIRFEVNGEKTLLKLNGRVVAQEVRDVPASASCGCSSVNCTIRNLSASSKLLVDDVKAFALVSPADYPPAPVRVKGEEKWDVIMNICSLWYNGRHAGWRCIERAGGPRPVLGYYDEGLPETADWEIKYMVDHGVDVQAFCWYPESHDGPIRHPRYEYQLRDGFKNARYSDRMKYCLIWEIENAGRPHTLEAWKKNYVPYLIEHHFKDPRYYAPDGKPMLAVFGGWNFPKKTAFGSPAETKAAFDYLEAELKKLGFKGLVTVSSNWHNGRDDLAACGFSARCAYNYGTEGWKVETQKTRNLARAAIPGAFVIPTVSVGFNSRPWHGKTYPMMSAADLKTSLAWVRDEFIPSQKHAEPWQAKAVWLSTWNEYGEGTYMMPTDDALGFGYLDAVRSVFTDEAPDPKLNIRPTDAQRARLCNLYREGLCPCR